MVQFTGITHTSPRFLRLVVGGNNLGVSGFNGLFSNIVAKIGSGAFLNSVDEF